MRFVGVVLIICSICSISVSQVINYHHFRSYKHNLLLQTDNTYWHKNVISDYGQLVQSDFKSKQLGYYFQGQEFDADLELYVFPARLFSSNKFRFFSPDPKSQYFSPYLFVDADPVNNIDLDGKEGKPLILYSEDHRLPESMPLGVRDLKEVYTDAHYHPISDLVNREIGDLPDWNGNVFIESRSHEGNLIVEESKSPPFFKTYKLRLNDIQGNMDMKGLSISPENLGREIQDFAGDRRVDLKNITIGRNGGGESAKSMAKGFIWPRRKKLSKGRQIRFAGVKKEYNSKFIGGYEAYNKGFDTYFGGTRYYCYPAEREQIPKVSNLREGGLVLNSFGSKEENTRPIVPNKYLERQPMIDYINGEIPFRNFRLFDVAIGDY